MPVREITLRQVMVATAMHIVQIRNTWRDWFQQQTRIR